MSCDTVCVVHKWNVVYPVFLILCMYSRSCCMLPDIFALKEQSIQLIYLSYSVTQVWLSCFRTHMLLLCQHILNIIWYNLFKYPTISVNSTHSHRREQIVSVLNLKVRRLPSDFGMYLFPCLSSHDCLVQSSVRPWRSKLSRKLPSQQKIINHSLILFAHVIWSKYILSY